MATALELPIAEPALAARAVGPGTWPRAVWRFCKRKPLGAVGGFVVLAMLVIALLVDTAVVGGNTPLLAPSGYNDQHIRRAERDQSPTLQHPLGTDELGRDMLSRVLYGIRISIIIGLSAVVLGSVVALAAGTLSGYFSGWTDTIVQRGVDILLAIPPIVLLIYSISVFASRSGAYARMFWIIIIVGAIISFGSTRVVRGAAISAANNQYVDAARTIGASHLRIVFRHIVPNVIPVVIVIATVNIGSAILAEAAISFLGYGIPPPFPSLGGMLNISGASQFRAHPLEAVWPGLAIALGVYGFNMFGDALRDVLDPRLRGGR